MKLWNTFAKNHFQIYSGKREKHGSSKSGVKNKKGAAGGQPILSYASAVQSLYAYLFLQSWTDGRTGRRRCRAESMPQQDSSPETVLNVELFFTAAEESENTDFVQQRTEGLLSLVMQARSRQVVFAWGDMNFRGELEEASAEYTMFHAKGNPMMARVSLSIRQAGADSPAQTSKSEYQYWKKAWNKFQKFAEERDGVL